MESEYRRIGAFALAAHLGIDAKELEKAAYAVWSELRTNLQTATWDRSLSIAGAALKARKDAEAVAARARAGAEYLARSWWTIHFPECHGEAIARIEKSQQDLRPTR